MKTLTTERQCRRQMWLLAYLSWVISTKEPEPWAAVNGVCAVGWAALAIADWWTSRDSAAQ